MKVSKLEGEEMIRLPRAMPKKLEQLIELHADLAGNIANFNTMHPDRYCIDALIEALKTVTKGTRLEGETLALIRTCEEVLYEEKITLNY